MTKNDPAKNDEDVSADNIFRIADELVSQVDRSKKLVVLMIVAVIVAIPVSWHVAPLLTGTPDSFRIVGYLTILIAAIFLAVGVRQWLVLSKWTRKYKLYKEKQKKIDQQLDFEDGEGPSTSVQKS